MFKRQFAYRYLMVWPLLAVIFTIVIDFQAAEFRHQRILVMSEDFLSDICRVAYNSVAVGGPAAITQTIGDEEAGFSSLDVYLADNDQQAVTKPKYSQIGTTITNKSIIRALECNPGEIRTWQSPSDYRGIPVICAYTSVMVDGEKVALLVEADQEETTKQIFAWWFFADALWIAFFASIAGLCLFLLRDDIVRIVRPSQERAESGYALVTKLIRQFPSKDSGIALVDLDGMITEASPSFARILGGLLAREVINTSVHSYHSDPERHRQYFESFKADIEDRPVVCKGMDGQLKPVFLSVTRLNGSFLVALRSNTNG